MMWHFDLLSFVLGGAAMFIWLVAGVLVTSSIAWVDDGGGDFPPQA